MEQHLITITIDKAEKMNNEEKMREFAAFDIMDRNGRLEKFGFDKQNVFAELYGITEKTLSIWKHKTSKFKKMKQEMLIEANIDRRLPQILNRLVERAEVDGDVAAIKEILKITEISKDKIEIINDSRINEILSQVVLILQEEIEDRTLLNRIAERIGEIDV